VSVCSTLTDADDIELKTSLQQLLLNLLGDTIETNMAPREDSIPWGRRRSHLEAARGVRRTVGDGAAGATSQKKVTGVLSRMCG